VLVRIDDEFDRHLGWVKNAEGLDVELIVDPKWRPDHRVKITGEIIASPEYLSGIGSPYYENYPGLPKPMAYRGSEQIAKKLAMMPEHYRKLKDKQVPYSCGGWSPSNQTAFGVPVETEVGDKAYFHYSTLRSTENFQYREVSGKVVYKVPYESLFCIVRNNRITMLNGNVLVDKYFDDDLEDVEVGDNTIRAKVKAGLVVQIGEKPKYLTGVLRHIGKPIGDQTRYTCAPGELIMFRPSSEFENTIEGHEYYVMKQWDLIAKVLRPDKELDELMDNYPQIEINNIIPVGDYLLVVPEDLEYKPEIIKKFMIHHWLNKSLSQANYSY